jgi:hypothetical protein
LAEATPTQPPASHKARKKLNLAVAGNCRLAMLRRICAAAMASMISEIRNSGDQRMSSILMA